ncbi:hypothetical protein INR49_021871 [Caranx melampygus]|nr:hypothetical protein INR49_021871 [Caranx melampygus]
MTASSYYLQLHNPFSFISCVCVFFSLLLLLVSSLFTFSVFVVYRSRPLGSLWANAAFGNAPEKDDVNRKKNTTAVANSM